MRDDLRAELVVDALEIAVARRQPMTEQEEQQAA
jgi:hypothetical protein